VAAESPTDIPISASSLFGKLPEEKQKRSPKIKCNKNITPNPKF